MLVLAETGEPSSVALPDRVTGMLSLAAVNALPLSDSVTAAGKAWPEFSVAAGSVVKLRA